MSEVDQKISDFTGEIDQLKTSSASDSKHIKEMQLKLADFDNQPVKSDSGEP